MPANVGNSPSDPESPFAVQLVHAAHPLRLRESVEFRMTVRNSARQAVKVIHGPSESPQLSPAIRSEAT